MKNDQYKSNTFEIATDALPENLKDSHLSQYQH